MREFCAKVLLFGEYSVVKGGKGLAVPFFNYTGKLSKTPESESEMKKKFKAFREFMNNSSVLASALDLERFGDEIEDGLSFESDIPQGAGVGSSGALCAAVYSRYLKNQNLEEIPVSEIMDHMSLMESYYHGSSSGLDPLISFAQKPVKVSNRNNVSFVDIDGVKPEISLLNTNYPRKTSPLVQKFLQMCEETDYEEKVKEFIGFSNEIIDAFLENKREDFDRLFYEISKWQFLNLRPMVCEKVSELWLEGLERKDYFIKLCGAGGGGHYLLYKKNPQAELNAELLKIKF